jgi:hypothetical protein
MCGTCRDWRIHLALERHGLTAASALSPQPRALMWDREDRTGLRGITAGSDGALSPAWQQLVRRHCAREESKALRIGPPGAPGRNHRSRSGRPRRLSICVMFWDSDQHGQICAIDGLALEE